MDEKTHFSAKPDFSKPLNVLFDQNREKHFFSKPQNAFSDQNRENTIFRQNRKN